MANGLLTGLESYLKMDEAANAALVDSHAADTFTVAANVGSLTGKLNTARQFQNSEFFRYDGSNAALNLRQNPMVSFTNSMWMKFNATPDTAALTTLWEQDDAAPNGGLHMGYRGHDVGTEGFVHYFFTEDDTPVSIFVVSAPYAPAVGTWVFIAWGYDAATGNLWIQVDGDARVNAAVGTDRVKTAGAVKQTWMGWEANGTDWAQADGDEMGIWSVSLTEAQVTTLYGSGTPPAYSTFDSGSAGGGGSDAPQASDYSDPSPLFSRNLEITNHLKANFLNTADAPAVVNIAYRQVPL